MWSFEKGELVAKDHDTLWTKKSYGNFILDLEFKVAKESNSGVFLRSGDIKNVLKALEIQVHDSADARVFIPLTPGRRSLNVTVSAAIGLSEALRQTDQFPKPVQIS